MSTFNQLTRSYRQHKKTATKIQRQIQLLQEKVQKLRGQENDIHRDLRLTKSLIDYCVETGESPVEAQLKNTPAEIVEYVGKIDLERAYGYGHDIFSSSGPSFNMSSPTMLSTNLSSNSISITPYLGTATITGGTISGIAPTVTLTTV
jgi:hypothetical protein